MARQKTTRTRATHWRNISAFVTPRLTEGPKTQLRTLERRKSESVEMPNVIFCGKEPTNKAHVLPSRLYGGLFPSWIKDSLGSKTLQGCISVTTVAPRQYSRARWLRLNWGVTMGVSVRTNQAQTNLRRTAHGHGTSSLQVGWLCALNPVQPQAYDHTWLI